MEKASEKKGFVKEFMDFLQTFGIIGLAIAFIIGAAASAVVNALVKDGAVGSTSLEDMVKKLDKPRAIWLMIPAASVDAQLEALANQQRQDIYRWPDIVDERVSEFNAIQKITVKERSKRNVELLAIVQNGFANRPGILVVPVPVLEIENVVDQQRVINEDEVWADNFREDVC